MSRRDLVSSWFHSQNPLTEPASGESCSKKEATGQEKVFPLPPTPRNSNANGR